MTAQHDSAKLFHALHHCAAPLALANVWDVAGARVVAATGAPAIATTSAGVAWGLGAADGDRLDREDAIALVARVVKAVSVPVTADIESGFGTTPDGVADTVRRVVEAGAVGVNIEDSHTDRSAGLRTVAEQSERIAAARAAADAAGIPLYINARTDTYLGGSPAGTRLQDTLDRARAYLAAGASGIFVPGAADAGTVAALAEGIDGPVNVLVGPGSLTVAELAELGVARVSLGSSIAEAAYALVRRAAQELAATGTYGALSGPIAYGELNALMAD